MERIGPVNKAVFFLYSGESLLSSGLLPCGPEVGVVPCIDLRLESVVVLPVTVLDLDNGAEFGPAETPGGTSVFSRGSPSGDPLEER
jgi:hypothetical protein